MVVAEGDRSLGTVVDDATIKVNIAAKFINSGDDLFGYRIALSVLGFLFYSILLYKFLNDGLESITKGVENGIKSAAR